jgi:hypothetical protein
MDLGYIIPATTQNQRKNVVSQVPASGNAETMTADQLRGGYINAGASALAGYALTTPTGTQLSAEFPDIAIGQTFEVYINNAIAQEMTWTAGATVTVVGTATLTASRASKAVFLCTAANTWKTYLIVN